MSMAARHRLPELMDDPALEAAAHRAALAGLARINRISGAADAVWSALRPMLERGRPIRLLDVACGGGDVLAGVLRRAAADGYAARGVACDISPVALETAAERATAAGAAVETLQRDALNQPLPGDADAAFCSLFLHHLGRADVVRLLARLGEAAPVLVVDDLVRSPAAWVAAWAGTRVLSRSPIVHVDGPRSVRAAFTPAELRDMADDAGLRGAAVVGRWPFRMLLTWRRA